MTSRCFQDQASPFVVDRTEIIAKEIEESVVKVEEEPNPGDN